MNLARKLELQDHCAVASAPTLHQPARAPVRALLPAPQPQLPLSAPNPATTTPATITVEGHPVQRLSQAQMEERRRLELCYNCNEKFGRKHNKVCQRLFLLDSVAEEEEEPVDSTEAATDTHISLHAIARVRTSETMQICLQIGDTTFLALLDSGSAHNLISEAVAANTSLPCSTAAA